MAKATSAYSIPRSLTDWLREQAPQFRRLAEATQPPPAMMDGLKRIGDDERRIKERLDGPIPAPAREPRQVRRRRNSPRQEMFWAIVKPLYPDGVAIDVQSATVQHQVAAAWKAECAAHGIPYFRPPEWDCVNRYLGRDRRSR